MRRYQCPVCGYDKMSEPPRSWYICPCCGTEFENDDDQVSHSALRSQWIAKGVPWFSSAIMPPKGWNGYQQLFDTGYWDWFISARIPADEVPVAKERQSDRVWNIPNLADLLSAFRPYSNA